MSSFQEQASSGCVAGTGSGPDPSTESNPLYSPARGRCGARGRDAGCGPRCALCRSRALWACAGRTQERCAAGTGPWTVVACVGRGHCTGCRSVAFGLRISDRYQAAVQTRGKVDRVERAQIFLLLSCFFLEHIVPKVFFPSW